MLSLVLCGEQPDEVQHVKKNSQRWLGVRGGARMCVSSAGYRFYYGNATIKNLGEQDMML